MLPQLACSEASQGDCPVAGDSHIHIQCFIDVNWNDFVHLILNGVKQSEGKVLLILFCFLFHIIFWTNCCVGSFIHICRVTVTDPFVVVYDSVCIATYKKSVVIWEFYASYSSVVGPQFLKEVLSRFCVLLANVKYPDRVVVISTNIQILSFRIALIKKLGKYVVEFVMDLFMS